MRYEVNDCCDCATESYPCLGSACKLRHVPKYVCDWCGADELDEEDIKVVDGEDVCLACVRQMEEENE